MPKLTIPQSLITNGLSPQGNDVYTYASGESYDMYKHSLAVSNALGFIEWMEDVKRIEPETAKNLKEMINSEDKDNFNIAILAIEQLKK
jgi:hypothetical protein